jgi:predicted flavoprotein YhiN
MADRNRVPFAIIGGGASGLVAAITAARLLAPQKIGPVVVLDVI